MKRFPFERRFRIESTPCTRCNGTGRRLSWARDTFGRSPECWNCKGLAWKPTPAGRDLFYEIVTLLGAKVTRRPTRIDPYLVPSRKLTPEELEAIDKLMAERVGNGAVEISATKDAASSTR